MDVLRILIISLAAMPLVSAAVPDELPVIPVGLDAYRMWEMWPYQRIGVRAYMRSTYDRTGGNRTADASHFLYQEADDFNVTLDVVGPGVLYFARYNHWHGSPWTYEIDGVRHMVEETSTADPLNPDPDSVFIPEHLFPNPLTWTWAITKGADLMWVPLPFEESFRMAYGRTRYGTGYYIYHVLMPGANLSKPVRSWDGKTPPPQDVLDLLAKSGSDLAPRSDSETGLDAGVKKLSGGLDLRAGERIEIVHIEAAPSMLRALEFSVPKTRAQALKDARLRITWDGREFPSVDAPMALFYGTGTFYNRDDKEYLVKGFPMTVRFDDERMYLACFFPMPFFESAFIEIEGEDAEDVPGIEWEVRYMPYTDPLNHVGYFHATYVDHENPVPGKDLVFLDTTEVEGGGDWSGSFVGTSFIFTDRLVLNTLEGDPRFFFDDSKSPQAYGTGTEEWGGGGDYWGGRTMTIPLAGHPVGAPNLEAATCDEDLIHSAYRFLLADLMPFGKNARIQFEHGGINESRQHYKSVTYWYGLPSPSLIRTDVLDVGDLESEREHAYRSPDASKPVAVTSRYELGPDTLHISDGSPLANPEDFADFEFYADADTRYYIWIRGKNIDGSNMSDAVWLQFNDDIGTYHWTRFLTKTHRAWRGFGNWLDRYPAGVYAWASGRPQDPPLTISFDKSGIQRMRMQTRHGVHYVDQVWLSTSQTTQPDFTEPRQKTASRLGDDGTPGRPIAEIVLDADDVKVLAGKLERKDDEGASIGRILVMNEPGETEIFPAHTEVGRTTTTYSEFTLNLIPENKGVLLRRTLDYAYPNQRAEIYVADSTEAVNGGHNWHPAGVWYLAGSNTCLFSNPPGELDPPNREVVTSNRRFRDDEFLISRHFTEGKSAIRVRVEFTPVEIPLYPGHPLAELAWSEIRYTAYCYVLPEWPRATE